METLRGIWTKRSSTSTDSAPEQHQQIVVVGPTTTTTNNNNQQSNQFFDTHLSTPNIRVQHSKSISIPVTAASSFFNQTPPKDPISGSPTGVDAAPLSPRRHSVKKEELLRELCQQSLQ